MTTNTQKNLLDEDTIAMIDAGFLTEDLKITKDLGYYIQHLNFVALKSKIVARAKQIVEEQKAE